jgi:putative transcriptional regulator
MGAYNTDSTDGVAPAGRIDAARVDATTEADIKRHMQGDELAALSDAGDYTRRIRRRLGLTQVQLAAKLDVPIDTLRNWEQGKRYPTGPAKALLKILDRAPEAALTALNGA